MGMQHLPRRDWKVSKLEDQSANCRTIAAFNMAADDEGQVLLLGIIWHARDEITMAEGINDDVMPLQLADR